MSDFANKTIIANVLCIFCLIGILSGCASSIPVTPQVVEIRHLSEKNYGIGVKQRTTVGEPVVRFKDYYLERFELPTVRPTHDIVMSRAVPPSLQFAANRSYPITSRISIDGIQYFVVPDLKTSGIAALVNPDGRVYGRPAAVVGGSAALAWTDFTLSPANAKMIQDSEERVVRSKGYVNFELIYNGTSGGTIYLTYREFTPDDVARTAFFQNLTYNTSTEIIRFRKLKLKIHAASNESIEFTVLEDS